MKCRVTISYSRPASPCSSWGCFFFVWWGRRRCWKGQGLQYRYVPHALTPAKFTDNPNVRTIHQNQHHPQPNPNTHLGRQRPHGGDGRVVPHVHPAAGPRHPVGEQAPVICRRDSWWFICWLVWVCACVVQAFGCTSKPSSTKVGETHVLDIVAPDGVAHLLRQCPAHVERLRIGRRFRAGIGEVAVLCCVGVACGDLSVIVGAWVDGRLKGVESSHTRTHTRKQLPTPTHAPVQVEALRDGHGLVRAHPELLGCLHLHLINAFYLFVFVKKNQNRIDFGCKTSSTIVLCTSLSISTVLSAAGRVRFSSFLLTLST